MNDNTNPTLTLTTIIEAAKAARSHAGGSQTAWYRLMSRNAYTVDPTRPEPDELDLEKERLLETARKLATTYIKQGPGQDDYGRISSVRYHCPELVV